jgi:Plavaka transposase
VAYPVYLTIGNIPKDIRRKPSRHAQILIGYIPTTSFKGIKKKIGRRRAQANLFHACMKMLLAPITPYSETGVAMMSADGTWRRCHPIFAIFIGDYPEQALVTCTYNGHCPKCTVSHDQLGEFQRYPTRVHSDALDIYHLADDNAYLFHRACREARLKPVYHPFWHTLPFADVYQSITPDILHQLLQGIIRHLVVWLQDPTVFGADKIDTRCQILPQNHSIAVFPKGITTLSRVSGQEHKNMCRILLGLIIGLPLPGGQVPSRVVKAARAILDFVYLAQLPSHTTETLRRLEESLSSFHANKDVFVDLGTRDGFNIPKLHSMLHYSSSILLFGTTDNYNTEQTERLHIDFTKDAYRSTNRKDEYSQMTTWLERRERVQRHAAHIAQQQLGVQLEPRPMLPLGPPCVQHGYLTMAQNPTLKSVYFQTLASKYGAILFQDALADFIAHVNHPGATTATLRNRAHNTLIPFNGVPVYHKIKFRARRDSKGPEIIDSVQVHPEHTNDHGRIIPGRFDTVLVCGAQYGTHPKKGKHNHINEDLTDCYSDQIAQVRVVFKIPEKAVDLVFPSADISPPNHLAYVEWFTPIPATPDRASHMYKISRMFHGGMQRASIIPVEMILCSVHLFPWFGQNIPQNWDSYTVLEECQHFYINPFSNMNNYLIFGK